MGYYHQFCLEYVDELLSRLQNFGYGCKIGHLYYANNVVLHAIKKDMHIGHIIGLMLIQNVLLDAANVLTRKVNFVLHNFHHCSYEVKFELFKSYCTL